MLNLIGLTLMLTCFAVCICLLFRQLFINNNWRRFRHDQTGSEFRRQPQVEENPPMRQPLDRQQLEQLVYSQWEQGLGEQLEQWHSQLETSPTLEQTKKAQRLREKWEQERQQQKEYAHSIDKAYVKAHWHYILGVPATASAEEIKRAYHKRMSEYHPDKVSTMGEKIIAVAEIESQRINAAYEYAQSQGLV
jgi:DnaJ-domain-containing protein 1